ncbi:unnamed protein product [Moneuplotes crassus]|uniref:Uncharacterized protein n=1 Tax=Euplotes crassus TaxID=5936 RepID=A0AAD1Y7N2_EUPCR|nr:unnamed protein product [Moneuplotes crassus]
MKPLKMNTTVLARRNLNNFGARLTSPAQKEKNSKIPSFSWENKKKTANYKSKRRALQRPLDILKNKVKSLSPFQRKIIQSAYLHSIELKSKVMKKTEKSNKSSGNEEFGHLAPAINKFNDLTRKVMDAKCASGPCKSSFVLNKKLETIKLIKERICPFDKQTRAFSCDTDNEFTA